MGCSLGVGEFDPWPYHGKGGFFQIHIFLLLSTSWEFLRIGGFRAAWMRETERRLITEGSPILGNTHCTFYSPSLEIAWRSLGLDPKSRCGNWRNHSSEELLFDRNLRIICPSQAELVRGLSFQDTSGWTISILCSHPPAISTYIIHNVYLYICTYITPWTPLTPTLNTGLRVGRREPHRRQRCRPCRPSPARMLREAVWWE